MLLPPKFKFCPECREEIPPIIAAPAEAVGAIRKQSAYSGARTLLDVILVLGILALLAPLVLFLLQITTNYYLFIIGVASLVNSILLRTIGHAIFDIADCHLATADQRSFLEEE